MISVVIPTRDRADYLAVALRSLAEQHATAEYEVIVVDDGSGDATSRVASVAGARLVSLAAPHGLNAARNAGVEAAGGELIAFLDDDVRVLPGWLQALADGAAAHPDAEAFGGPIWARFEGPTPGSCGRERPPVTTLDLGEHDREAPMVWGANMAVRRTAFTRLGPFDETVGGHGDEEDWLLALRAAGGRIVYLAGAGLEHRRAGADAGLRALSRAAFQRGAAARRTDERRGRAPSLTREARVLLGCGWHAVRYVCPQGIIMGAHTLGRLAATRRSD